jgi:glycosyltransferase involved in cell wall biosynthesis
MILKNEAKTITKALESIIDLVDEIIIAVDDKTIDSTYDICDGYLKSAASLKNKKCALSKYKFINDFATARNALIDQAQSDWVFILDGHEHLDPSSFRFLNMLKKSDVSAWDIFDFNIVEIDARSNVIFQQPRLFRKFIRYQQAVHNVIMEIDRRVALPQVVIYHDQPSEQLKQRQDQRQIMNVDQLLVKANEGDIRSMYYLGNTYYEFGSLDDCLLWYVKYLEAEGSNFYMERYAAKVQMAYAYKALGQKQEVKKILTSCFDEKVPLNEHLVMLGDLEFEDQMYEKAAYYYRLATSVKLPHRFVIISEAAYTWLPWYRLALCYLATDDLEGVRECINKGKQFAPEREEFFELENKVNEKIKIDGQKKKGKIYIVASLISFIEPIVNRLKQDYYIRFESNFNPANADLADVIWCEWADHNAIAVSNYKGRAKKILRIHAYEVFSQYMERINFDAFDKIVFIADHIKDHFTQKIKIDPGKIELIHNGVDLTKFQVAKDKKINNKIAYAGFISNKKGAPLLKHIMYSFPEMEFHIAGTFQEQDVELNFKNKTRPPMHDIFMYGWQEDLNAFFADKTYILNTSIREGCPVSVLEAMACGLEPLIFNWIGADKIFPRLNIFDSYQCLSMSILDNKVDFRANRRFVAAKYDFDKKYELIKMLIDDLIKEIK